MPLPLLVCGAERNSRGLRATRVGQEPPSKKLKKVKKRLDKMLELCYNKYSERESSRGYLFKSPTPLAVDHSALSQRVEQPPDPEKGLSESRANKSGKKHLTNDQKCVIINTERKKERK